MLILPTMGRPHNLKRFVDTYLATEATIPIYIIFDAADAHNYVNVDVPKHFKRTSVPAGTRLGDIYRIIFHNFPNEAFYGVVADDLVPETPHWDVKLRDACLPNKIAWGFDGIQNERLPTHPFIGGELLRKLGWWAVPGVQHWFIDNVWKILADELKVGVYLPEVRMMHHHVMNQKAPLDHTYANQPDTNKDQAAYLHFMQYEMPAALARARG